MKTRSLGDGIEIHQWYPIIIWYPRIHQTIPYKTWDSSPVFCLSHHPDLDQNHEEKNSVRRGAKEEWPEQGLEATGGHQQQPHFKGFHLAKYAAKTSGNTTPENNTEWCIHLHNIYIYTYILKKNMYNHVYIYIYSEGTCPRRLLYHLFEAPVLGPWAHLGFEKKRPQSLNKRPTKAWGSNRNGLDVKLLTISRKTSKAPVANHNGLDAKLLSKEFMKNY